MLPRVGAHRGSPVGHGCSVLGAVPTWNRPGSWAIASSRRVTWSAIVFAVALPGRSIGAECLARGVGEAEHRMKAEPSFEIRGSVFLGLGVDVHQRRVDVEHDGARHVEFVPDPGSHLCQPAGECAAALSGPSSWNVRKTVVQRGPTEEGVADTQVLDVAASSPPPASTSAIWTSTLPRSCSGARSPFGSMQRDRQAPRPILSAKDPNACSPTCATTPVPPDSTLTRVVEVLCISKVPSVFGDWLVSKHQFPLHRGHFRGLTSVAARCQMNDRGWLRG